MSINLMELIDGFNFPGTKAEIIEYAQENDASEDALDILQGMPDMYYDDLGTFNRHVLEIDLLPGAEMNQYASAPEDKTLS